MSGYYSIIQYMPEPERREGVNLGIMLLDKAGPFRWVLLRPIRRIQRVFPGTDSDLLNGVITAFYNRIAEEAIDCLDDLTNFTIHRGGVVQCTEPCWVDFKAEDFHKTLEDLMDKLVY